MIPWSTRRDLVAFAMSSAPDSPVTIKDEIRNDFFHFGGIEFFILESLKSPHSFASLTLAIEENFGVRLEAGELEGYIQHLVRDNLLIAHRFGDGKRLFQQAESHQRSSRTQAMLRLLSIRLPGFHPGNILSWLAPFGWILFHPLFVVASLLATLFTLGFSLASIHTITQKIPSFQEMTQPTVIAWMFPAFILAKVLHELGHGLACRKAGHECSEMGVMLLVGIPCMYCDVSDVWTQPNRWLRIFVSLAGIYVELLVALVCFWGWYFSTPSVLHCLSFGLMLVTSINTLFVNGNPLMRYDGYYALSDWVQIPNLAGEARGIWLENLQQWFIEGASRFRVNQPTTLLCLYAIAAGIYRLFIMVAIGWAAWSFFESQQLVAAGKATVLVIASFAMLPLLMTTRTLSQSAWNQGLKLTNVTVAVALTVLLYFSLAAIKFEYRVRGSGQFDLARAQILFAPADGEFQTSLEDGQQVQEGQTIANLIDPELDLETRIAEGESDEIQTRLELLELSSHSEDAGQLAYWRQRQKSVTSRLADLQDQKQRLTIRAPVDGKLVAFRIPETTQSNDAALETVSESRFHRRNRSSHVQRGERLAYVAATTQLQAIVNIRETEIEFVSLGQVALLRLPYTNESLEGTVTRIALESEQDEASTQSSTTSERFIPVECEFPSHPSIRIGSTHEVAIRTRTMSPLGYISHWWKTTFWF